MTSIVISGSGLYTPPFAVSNEALVAAFNQYVDLYNEENASAIDAGQLPAKQHSSSEFIEKASGIKSRYLVSKEGCWIPTSCSRCCLSGLMTSLHHGGDGGGRRRAGADRRRSRARRDRSGDCRRLQHAAPLSGPLHRAAALSGAGGMAFDMNVACSSATFGIKTAADMLAAGSARLALVVNPEICSGHLNFRDRDSHFIFGDACTAVLLERKPIARRPTPGNWWPASW